MDLDQVKSIDEAGDHFVVHHEDRSFRLSKSSLPADVQESIRSVAKGKAAAVKAIANMPGADGVIRAEDGVEVESPTEAALKAIANIQATGYGTNPPPGVPGVLPGGDIDPNKLGHMFGMGPGDPAPGDPPPTPVRADLGAVPPKDIGPDPAPGSYLDLLPNIAPISTTGGPGISPVKPEPVAAVVPLGEDVVRGPAYNTNAGYVATAGAPGTPGWKPGTNPVTGSSASASASMGGDAPPKIPGMGVLPKVETTAPEVDTKEFDEGLAAHQASIQHEADLNSALSADQTTVQEDLLAKRDAITKDFLKKKNDNQGIVDSLARELADPNSSKINTGRVFHDLSTGNKILAGLSILAGAAGAGMAHSANYAGDYVDKVINDDVEAQKHARGRKETLLGHYVQQGHDLESAENLAKADAYTYAAAQAERNRARWSGPLGQAAALGQISALKMKATGLRDEVAKSQFVRATMATTWEAEQKHRLIAMQKDQSDMRAREYQMRLERWQAGQVVKAQAQATAQAQNLQQAREQLMSGKIPITAAILSHPELGKGLEDIAVPTGNPLKPIALTFRKEDAGKATGLLQPVTQFESDLRDYEKLREKYGSNGIWHALTDGVERTDYERAHRLRDSLSVSLLKMKETGVISDSDLERARAQVADITSSEVVKEGAAKQNIKDMFRSSGHIKQAIAKTHFRPEFSNVFDVPDEAP